MDGAAQPTSKEDPTLAAPDFRLLFESAPGAVAVMLPDDPVFTVVAASDGYVQLSGMRREEMLGRGVFEIFPDNPQHPAASAVRSSLRRVIATRAPDKLPSYRYDIERPAGEGGGFEERWRRHLSTPVCDPDGAVQYMLYFVEYVTGEVRAEAGERVAMRELRTSNTRFHQLAEISTLGLVIGDLNGGLSYLNPTMRELLGYTEEDVAAGLVRWDLITPPEFACVDAEAVRQLMLTGECAPYEKAYIAKSGKRVPILLGASLLESSGDAKEVVAFVVDLRERKRAERCDAFLVQLADAVRPLADPQEITQTVLRLLSEHIQADRGFYCTFESDEETFHITSVSTRPGVPGMLGRYTLQQFGIAQLARANLPCVVEDVESDPGATDGRDAFRQAGVRAFVWAPLHRAGRLVAALGVHQSRPRHWLPDEIELIQQVANRCCESLERAHSEFHLRQQCRTFDIALSNTPDFTYIFDLEGRFTYVNRALLSLWQKPLEEALGKNFFELDYPSELAARLQRQIQQVIDTKEPVRDDTPFTGPTGETRHYEYIFVPVFGGEGQVEAVAGSTRDVTDRDRMEQALAASEERLQQIFAQAPVAIVVLRGREFLVELANPSYQALFQGRNLVDRRFGDVVPEAGSQVWKAFYQVLDTGEAFVANEFFVPYDQDGDGAIEDHWFNVVYHPLRAEDDSVSGIVAVCNEVTTQVRARHELERVNRELEEFAYVASHDLQEPLRMVNIYSQLLLNRLGTDDADLNQYAGFIREGVTRMEALIRDLLTFSHTVHKDDAAAGTADLMAALAEAQSVLRDRIEECGAIIAAQPLPTVRGDTDQMVHVFQNLLSNALKYRNSELPPNIYISVEPEGGSWIISVRDNGIGFEPQYAKHIFGLFKRLYKDEYPGTGLGLAICQRTIERYGGRMWADGRPGEGATFYFSLPRVDP
jgi:PAS domain S-box-containing protein